MDTIITLIVIAVVGLLGYFVPQKFNEYFMDEYHQKIISTPLAVTTAILVALWLILMDTSAFWYWALLIAAIVLCVISIIYVIYIGLMTRASIFEILIAIIVQMLAIAGVVIIVLGVVVLLMDLFTGKKKRKR